MRTLLVLLLGGLALGCTSGRRSPPQASRVVLARNAHGQSRPGSAHRLQPPLDLPGGERDAGEVEPDETGRASYYADSLAGNTTASGERYDPQALTAAHRELPFGTVVMVTRVDTGASVRVRINDRGPFAHDRVIDLSRRAAEQIDMMRAGVVDVELRVMGEPDADR